MVVLVGTARSDINQEPIHRGRDQNPSTVSQQSRSSGAAGGDYLWTAWLTTFPKLQVSYIKYLDISWEISGIGYFSLAKGQGSSFRGRTSQLWTSVRPLSIRREDWGVPLAPPACIQQVSGRLQLQVHISISRNPWASTAPSPTPNEMTKTNAFWQQSCVCVPQKSIINWITNFTPDIKSLGGNTIFPLHFLQPAFVAPFSVGRTNLEADSGQETWRSALRGGDARPFASKLAGDFACLCSHPSLLRSFASVLTGEEGSALTSYTWEI